MAKVLGEDFHQGTESSVRRELPKELPDAPGLSHILKYF